MIFGPSCDKINIILENRLDKVIINPYHIDPSFPCVFYTGTQRLSLSMLKLCNNHQIYIPTKYMILNPKHSIIKHLQKHIMTNENEDYVIDLILLLFSILSISTVENPLDIIVRMYKLIERLYVEDYINMETVD